MRFDLVLKKIAFCAAIAAPAWAQDKARQVGNDSGGAPFEIVYEGYLTGIRLKQGNYVDAIGAFYTQIEPQTLQFTGNQVGRGVGGPGGAENDVPCGPISLVVGLRITAIDNFVGNVEPLCENQKSGFRNWVGTGWRAQIPGLKLFGPFYGHEIRNGIYSGDPMNCPQGQAAVGFYGRSGQFIDAVGLICKRLPRHDAAPPPPPPLSGAPMPPIREVGKAQRCDGYAARATAMKDQAGRCGLSGPRFDASYDGHRQFCMANPRRRAEEEDRARADALADCGKATAAYCTDYARRAMDRQELGRVCGLKHPHFSVPYQGHVDWCKGVSRAEAGAQDADRDRDVANCKDKLCEAYANRSEARRFWGNLCGLKHAHYAVPRAVHVSWCKSTPWRDVVAQEQDRDAEISACKKGK